MSSSKKLHVSLRECVFGLSTWENVSSPSFSSPMCTVTIFSGNVSRTVSMRCTEGQVMMIWQPSCCTSFAQSQAIITPKTSSMPISSSFHVSSSRKSSSARWRQSLCVSRILSTTSARAVSDAPERSRIMVCVWVYRNIIPQKHSSAYTITCKANRGEPAPGHCLYCRKILSLLCPKERSRSVGCFLSCKSEIFRLYRSLFGCYFPVSSLRNRDKGEVTNPSFRCFDKVVSWCSKSGHGVDGEWEMGLHVV